MLLAIIVLNNTVSTIVPDYSSIQNDFFYNNFSHGDTGGNKPSDNDSK